MPIQDYPPSLSYATLTITNGQTASAILDVSGTTLCGIFTPATLTGTSLSFQTAAAAADSFVTMRKNGADLSVPVAANRFIVLDPADFAGVRFVKIVSSATEAADRAFTVAARPV